MNYSDFIGEAQNRIELGTQAKSVRACRAVISTLSERLYPGEADDLAGALPMEIDHYARETISGQSFDRDEFIRRVANISECDEPEAFRQIQVIFQIMDEVVPPGEMRDIYESLPEEYEDFFELVETDLD